MSSNKKINKSFYRGLCFERGGETIHALKCECEDDKDKPLNYWQSAEGKKKIQNGEKYKEKYKNEKI